MSDINFLRPRRLRPGARVALIAPAGPVTEERVARSVERCAQLELQAVVGSHVHERTRYLAGDDKTRARDLVWAFGDPSIDAVWALRGGYGTMRLAQHVDFDAIAQMLKPYIGFSDNTFIHLQLSARRVVSFHGPHSGGALPPETMTALRSVLFHDQPAGRLPLRAEDPAPQQLTGGQADGPLVGGNLSLLAAACGTDACMRADGCIVFIEEVGEPAYRIDRMFAQLDMSGALNGVRGFAFGCFSELPGDELEADVVAVLEEVAARYRVPAVYNFPIGHVNHNWTLPLGVRAVLDADACALELVEAAVSES